MPHFDKTFSYPEPVVTSQPQTYKVTKYATICREFWNKLSQ